MNQTQNLSERIAFMLLGNLLISLGVSMFRLAGFGTDPFTAMNLGISMFIGWSFGTWQLTVNIFILIIIFLAMRKLIGAGTLVNMVFVGYIADFVCWLVQDTYHLTLHLPVRILLLMLALLFASLGVALYMRANMGISPYDSVAPLIEKLTGGRIPFHIARILSDLTVLAIGIVFCIASGNHIWQVVGIGTVCNALMNGPCIQFFRKQLDHFEIGRQLIQEYQQEQ